MKINRTVTLSVLILGIAAVGCGKEEKSKGKVGAKVRSTGDDLSLLLTTKAFEGVSGLNLQSGGIENSDVTLDYYKVPVSRVNLVTGLAGSGYSSASPNLYTCSGATDAECLVNLADKSAVDNLLKTAGKTDIVKSEAEGADQTEIPDATYNGTSIEFCHESQSFSAVIKASVTIGATTYFTNTASGVSTSGPSEEIKVPVTNIGCGMTTPLFEPLTISADSEVNVVLYTDPAGAVTGKSFKPSNIGCAGTTNTICTDAVGVFSTVDDAAPKIERYSLDLGEGKAKGLLTLILNSSNQVFGVSTRSIYANTSAETILGPQSFTQVVNNSDGSIDLKIWDNSALADFIVGFKRSSHSGTFKYNSTSAAVAYTATRL
jgi:hypothetical protein